MNIPRALQLQITGPDRKKSYGGDQGWFSSNTKAAGGCGSVAGANALRALAQLDEAFRKQITSSKTIPAPVKDAMCSKDPGRESFALLMTGVYETMGSFEIFPLNLIYDRKDRSKTPLSKVRSSLGRSNTGFIIGLIRFMRKFSVDIAVKSLPAAFVTKEKARDFITEGLRTSGSVVMLTCKNKHNVRLFDADADLSKRLVEGRDTPIKSHFTTITDIDLDRLLITTWGKPGVVDFNELVGSWQSIRAYEACLLYIVPATRKEATKCMFSAWKVFLAGLIHSLKRS